MNKFLEYERQYCNKINNRYMSFYKPPSNNAMVTLKDIYAPLVLKNIDDFVFRSLEESAILTLKEANKPPKNADGVSSILLYEAAGSGKTMFMKRLSLALLENDSSDWDFVSLLPPPLKQKIVKGRTIPLYLDLNADKANYPTTDSFLEFLFLRLCKMYPSNFMEEFSLDSFKLIFDELAETGKLCLLLDHLYAPGFNFNTLTEIVNYLKTKNCNNLVISSARTTSIREFHLTEIFDDEYRVVFTDESKHVLIHKLDINDEKNCMSAALRLNSWVRNWLYHAPSPWYELAQTPLGITKLYILTKNRAGMIPKNRALAYEALVNNALEDLTDKKTEKALRTIIESLGRLGCNGQELDRDQLSKLIDQLYHSRTALRPIENNAENRKHIETLIRVTGLVGTHLEMETCEFVYSFYKSSMMSYLGANDILRRFSGDPSGALEYIKTLYNEPQNKEILKFLLLITNSKTKNNMIEDMFNANTNQSWIPEMLLYMYDNWDAFDSKNAILLFSYVGKSRIWTAVSVEQIENMIKQKVPPECFPDYGYHLAIAFETGLPFDYAADLIESGSEEYKENALFVIWSLCNRRNLSVLFPGRYKSVEMHDLYHAAPKPNQGYGIDYGFAIHEQPPTPWFHLWNDSSLELSEADEEIMNRFDDEFKDFSNRYYATLIEPALKHCKRKHKIRISELLKKITD